MADQDKHKPLDRSMFEQIFKSHFEYLCNFALQYVEDLDAAQEICQKVFINLWERRSAIDANQSIKSYLFTAVRNKCLNHIRDNKKYRSRILDLDCGDIELEFNDTPLFSDTDELKNIIENALSELPEKCRMVFEMSRFQQMKYREIAEELDISQKTVEAHMSKAIKFLRNELKDYSLILLLLGLL